MDNGKLAFTAEYTIYMKFLKWLGTHRSSEEASILDSQACRFRTLIPLGVGNYLELTKKTTFSGPERS